MKWVKALNRHSPKKICKSQVLEKRINIISHQGNANQNHNEVPLHFTMKCHANQKEILTRADQDVQKLEFPHIAGRNVKWSRTWGRQFSNS